MRIYSVLKLKWFWFVIYVNVAIILVYFVNCFYMKTIDETMPIQEPQEHAPSIDCYRIKTLDSLPDISMVEPKKGKSIFFLETSCSSYENGKITIKNRQACAVESAAKLNPNFDVYLLFSSPGNIKKEGDESDILLELISMYDNVKIMHVDYEDFTKGTPVETLYSSGQIENSLYKVSHASDVLRFLTLWKYGGIYLDLDTLVLKSFENLTINFAGLESDLVVGSAIMGFEPSEKGKSMVESCLENLKMNFNGQLWTSNGPDVITNLVFSLCEKNDTKFMVNSDCNGFNLFPTNAFFPVPWFYWERYFDENSADYISNITQQSYIIHLWNKLSYSRLMPIDSNVGYLNLARKNCPKVFAASQSVF